LCQREALLLLKLKILLSLLLLLLKRLLRLEILKIGEPKLRRQIELGLDLREARISDKIKIYRAFIYINTPSRAFTLKALRTHRIENLPLQTPDSIRLGKIGATRRASLASDHLPCQILR
jgi:hypothetical protein